MLKTGVTQELRARVQANLAAQTRQRWLATTAIVIAVIAACTYVVARWLL